MNLKQNILRYLEALRYPPEEAQELLGETLRRLSAKFPTQQQTPLAAMNVLQTILHENPHPAADADFYRNNVMPPMQRSSMIPQDKNHLPPERFTGKQREYLKVWFLAALTRRSILFLLVGASVYLGVTTMFTIQSDKGMMVIEWLILCIFAILFAWIAFNFWVTAFGFLTLTLYRDRYDISYTYQRDLDPIPEKIKTAIVMPVYNEDVFSIFARIKSMNQSLANRSEREYFHFFILSDTRDPDRWVEEEIAWAKLCHEYNSFGKIFYRHRHCRIGKKSGNIADFCRRWGKLYEYMIIVDADSWMSGELMTNLVKIMEKRPHLGILQTVPQVVGQKSFLSRIQQFASHIYSPLHLAGSHFWQLGDAGFWGHNAIIRMDPFLRYCALPELSGHPPLGGKILSHDFVEAALMRRAGWEVWLVPGLKDSYEQLPPNLLGELARDQRWCLGNLQHLKLVFMKGFSLGHRLIFLIGNMFYCSSLLWFALLVLLTLKGISTFIDEPDYFSGRMSLFPDWPIQYQHLSRVLLVSTVIFLFMSKILSLIYLLLRQQIGSFGGIFRLTCGIIIETIISMLYAPIRMLFHSRFILLSLFQKKFEWTVQHRDERKTRWRHAVKAHGFDTALALGWGITAFVINETLWWWLSIVLIPILCSIPLSVWSGSVNFAAKLKRIGLLLIPEEIHPSEELSRLWKSLHENSSNVSSKNSENGFSRVLTDPWMNILHRALLRKDRKLTDTITQYRETLVEKVLKEGADRLTAQEKKYLLFDPSSLRRLHYLLWNV